MFRSLMISAALGSIAICLPQTAWGDEAEPRNTSQPAFELSLPLALDGHYLGDITTKIQGGNIEIDTARLKQLLAPQITTENISALEQAITKDFHRIDDISIEGFTFHYDPQLLQINVDTVLDARKPKSISVRQNSAANRSTALEPADFSLFVTPTARFNYDWEDAPNQPKGLRPVSGQVDFGGRIGQSKGFAFTTRLKYGGGQDKYLNRTESQVIYDMIPRFIRTTAGDIFSRGESFQVAPTIAGISIEKFFDFDSRRNIRPAGRQLFDLDRPSTLEVYNNGVLRYRQNLDSGRYDLSDLPLVQGSNNIQINLTDDLGQETILSGDSFFDFDLLEKGLSDFAFSAGVKSRRGVEGVAYSGEPVMSGFYRRGLTDYLTASVNLQGDENGANGGATGLFATPLGSFFLEGAISQYKSRDFGYALGGSYRLNKSLGEKNWALNLSSRYKSAAFTPVSSVSNASPLAFSQAQYESFELSADSRLSGKLWSASAFASFQDARQNQRLTAGLGGSYRIRPDISLTLFAQHTEDDRRKEQRVTAQVSWRIGPQMNARAQYDSGQNRAQYSINKATAQHVGSLSYGLGGTYSFDTKQSNHFANAIYTGNRFVATARHATGLEQGFDVMDNTSQLNLSSSLVFADGSFSIARPVRENFVIVKPHRSISDNQISLNPSVDGVTATSDFLGPAVMTEISPFDSRLTYIDVDDLPVGYDIGSNGFTTKPYLHSGYKFLVGTDASYSVIGNVIDVSTGEVLRYLGARFESLDHPDAEPVPAFTNRNGRLAATGLLPGRHRLTFITKSKFSMEIVIPDSDEALVKLGKIEVATR